MNSKILSVLEFNKIMDMLAEQASSTLAKEKIAALMPMNDRHTVQDALTETTEAVSVILYKGSIPIGNLGDISDILNMARKGRCLSMRELLDVKRNLQITREVKSFLSSDMPDGLTVLPEMSDLLVSVSQLEKDINNSILSEDEMSDSASPELKNIRREIRNKNDSIKSRMQKMISGSSAKNQLQDCIVTMRNGRYVIPVKKEYQAMYPGMVHDQSATGATLFIEPQSIVNLNNELKELAVSEQAEITRILQAFSDRVAEHYDEFMNNQKLLVSLDFINAKGKLACVMDASCPHLNEENILDLRCGRHPLLPKDKAVPTDVQLGTDWTTLLITGPNTGGKTVTLKTIGLLCLMAQSGLHIPADEKSQIPILKEIFADIGDEQSIEQSLSTFSSHMKNIIEIFENAGSGSLVLLDELGAGTDPFEGAALGIAELEKLRQMGSLIVATTHYTELKQYALSTEGVENASMEFNVETLSPTYKLRVGLPGKSNAFEISRKLGLSEEIIERATELLGENRLNFEEAVSRVEQDQIKSEKFLAEASLIKSSADENLFKAEQELDRAKQEASEILEKAKHEARQMLRDAQDSIDEISEELRALKNQKPDSWFDEGHISGGVANSRRRLREEEIKYKGAIPPKTKQTGQTPEPEMLEIGTKIKYTVLDQNGEVESLPDSRGNLRIRVGSIKMNANIKDLVIIESEKPGNKAINRNKYASMSFDKAKKIRPEINVIGKNLDDAIDIVLKYIDDAFLSGLKSVQVIHGRGEGILRNGIREVLRKNRHVKTIKSAEYHEGGEGCTIVEFKDK